MLVAIRERDAAVSDADRRAGKALTEMVDIERLSTREAAQWCGEEVSAREIARLRRIAADAEQVTSGDAANDTDTGADTTTTTEAATASTTATDAAASISAAS